MDSQYPSYPKWVYVKTSDGVIEPTLLDTPDDLKKITTSWAESPAGPFSAVTDPKKAFKAKRASKRVVVGGG
jgi:hypothetical protein